MRSIHAEFSQFWRRAGGAAVATVVLLMLLAACSGPDSDRPVNDTPTATSAAPTATTATSPSPDGTSTAPATPTVAGQEPTQAATEAPSGPSATPTATTTPPPVASETPTTEPEPTPTEPLPVFDPERVSVDIEVVASGFSEPLYLTHAGDGSGRIFVAEKTGAIRLLDGSLYLDLTDRVIKPGVFGRDHELGFLGMAFHPRFAETGWLYVFYSDFNTDSVISRFTVGPDGLPDPASEMEMFRLPQPDVNFNGGGLLFGPDGYLYIGTGTGGEPYDLQYLAQDPGSLYGKILRVDVDHGEPYTIPPDNPLVNEPGARPEVYILGLRNPYRFAFDRATGDLFIGGPGQFAREWIEYLPAGEQNGAVLRWPIMEGSICWQYVELPCDPGDYPPPIIEYETYSNGTCVILGGEVYRGERYPLLQGAYLFGDFCSAPLYIAWPEEDGTWNWREELRITGGFIGSFGTDEAGEVYVTDILNGTIYRIVAHER